MQGIAILALVAAFLPFLVSLGGRGGVWKFLSFLFCCFSIGGAASVVGIGGGILAWLVAWVFAAIAANARRSDERFAQLERRLLAEQEAAMAASPVEQLIRKQEPRQRFVTARQVVVLVLVFGLAAALIFTGVTSDQATIPSNSTPASLARLPVKQPEPAKPETQEDRARAVALAPKAAPLDIKPQAQQSALQSPPAAATNAPAARPSNENRTAIVLTAAAIAALIVAESRRVYYSTGHPCACPDDRMRNGRACGGRSAYSRPGGAAPLCYPTDVPEAMIETYRERQLAAR
ncbi:hypothetical protein [Bradyrhizobium sp. RT11b]|uniref:hypothetical protein n=1 Tax=Bradyrhizobium sp. RT11b TaxID=3156332 RepID=UPI0033957C6C